jgi:predicted DNA-binding transcriptional regulator YafY
MSGRWVRLDPIEPDHSAHQGRSRSVETEERLAALRVKIIEACANREPLLGLLDRLDAAARERPSALDVERLAAAIHEHKQCDFGYCEGIPDHTEDARGIAAEYARLTEPDAGEGTER